MTDERGEERRGREKGEGETSGGFQRFWPEQLDEVAVNQKGKGCKGSPLGTKDQEFCLPLSCDFEILKLHWVCSRIKHISKDNRS